MPSNWKRWILGLLLAALTAAMFGGCVRAPGNAAHNWYLSDNETFWAKGAGGIAVTEEAHATRVAVKVLRAGGNAVDAVVAAAFALAVTYPEAGNIGGGGFMIAFDPEGDGLWALDFRETAPAAAYAEMYLDLAARRKTDANEFGPLAAGVPGTPAGLHAAWEKYGSVPWADLVTPAVRLAREGFPVGERLGDSFSRKASDLWRYRSTRKVFFARGGPPRAGRRLVQNDLATSLEQIADEGPAAFYKGALAKKLVAGVRQAGGIWTSDDLAGYRPLFRKPHRVKLPPVARRHSARSSADLSPAPGAAIELVSMPPPSSGALVHGQAVAFLRSQDAFDLAPDDARGAAALVEALRLSFADRNTRLADPTRMGRGIDELLGSDYLAERARLLPAEPPGDSNVISGGHPGGGSLNTTTIVVMDDRGGVVALTVTINALFGCKFVVPGTGILLNNEMDDFDTRPGQPNMYGLVGSGMNAVSPGARMLSSMSPTIVLQNGRPWLALGARGGPRILSAVLQVVLNRCYKGMDLAGAIAAPRIHHQWWPDEVFFERVGEADGLRAALEAMGYTTGHKDAIGRVIAAEALPDGRYVGVRDPRISGLALPVEHAPAKSLQE